MTEKEKQQRRPKIALYFLLLSQRFSNSEMRPSIWQDAMLEGMCMTPGNRHAYTSFIDNSLIYGKWQGCEKISLSIRGLAQSN